MPLDYNIHIYPNPLYFSSRIEKITRTIEKLNKYRIIIFGIHSKNLTQNENLSEYIEIKRLKLFWGIHTSNTFLKIAQSIEFMVCIYVNCLNKNIKVINIHTLSMLPMGVVLKFIKGSVLIYDIHELETEKFGWSKFRRSFARLLERIFIKFTDKIIVVSPEIANWYKNEYDVKSTLILNAAYSQDQNKINHNLQDQFKFPPDATVFVYVGSFSAGRCIDLLLEVFKQINSLDKVIIFIGHGDYQNKIIKAQQCYKNIFFHPSISFEEIPASISEAHFGLALIENVCLSYYYSLPTKIFDYIAAGIPIICSNMLEISLLVNTHHLGLVINELTVEHVRDVIENVDKKTSLKYLENQLKVQPLYNWDNEEKKMIEIYNSLI